MCITNTVEETVIVKLMNGVSISNEVKCYTDRCLIC
jgi:hypothetical protein